MVISELVLNGILHLFALKTASQGTDGHASAREVVRAYLTDSLKIVSPDPYISLFDGFLSFYDDALAPEELVDRAGTICEGLKGHIPRLEQYTVFLRFLELSAATKEGDEALLLDLGHALGRAFGIDPRAIPDMAAFVYRDMENLTPRHLLLLPEDPEPKGNYQTLPCHRLFRPHFSGRALILRIPDINTLFLAPLGESTLTVNSIPVPQNSFCLFPPGGILGDSRAGSLYYAEIIQAVAPETRGPELVFTARHADFRFPDSDNGLHDFSFSARGGEMIGVMGGSGVGKSTLLNILSGTLPPASGEIRINGLDLYRDSRDLEGVIGFIPQDDLLFDELTVYENLYYSSRLCLADLGPADLDRRVEEILTELNQLETRDLKVGSPLEKTISGGQRKRLNIALELIREPSVLFVDEPTSGLSSADSLKVISLLKEQSAKGKLIIVIIHQPSSEIFKMFDQLWLLDKGGRPIYTGNPIDALVYFRDAVWQAGTQEVLCPACGNVNPEQLFDIIAMKQLDEQGYATDQRRFSPEHWHARHLSARSARTEGQTEDKSPRALPAPARALNRPGLSGQFAVFFKRSLLTRITNAQYLMVNLLEAPVLAWIIAMVSRFEPAGGYSFAENHNIPVYFFMSVIVALFMGLSVSAEEIIRDRRILKRERFLALSWFSYINAKILYLGLVAAIQTGLYTLVGNWLLGIPDFFFSTWLTLFVSAACASLIGLNISAAFRTVVTIYIMIPLLLVPQIILGGMTVPFDDLIRRDSPHNRVPLTGNLMPSRWGFEALITRQFSANPAQQPFNDLDRRISQADYLLNYYIPELKSRIDYPFLDTEEGVSPAQKAQTLALLKTEFSRLAAEQGLETGRHWPALDSPNNDPNNYNRDIAAALKKSLKQLAKTLHQERRKADQARRALRAEQIQTLGKEGYDARKARYQNKRITNLVRNRENLDAFRIAGNRIIRLSDPIFTRDLSPFGGAPFMAGTKQLGSLIIPTFAFNLGILWLIALLFYAALYWQLLPRLLTAAAILTKSRS